MFIILHGKNYHRHSQKMSDQPGQSICSMRQITDKGLISLTYTKPFQIADPRTKTQQKNGKPTIHKSINTALTCTKIVPSFS